MTSFKDLSGVPSTIADLMIRVELGLANIPVLQVVRAKECKTEVDMTVVGILEFADPGEHVVFFRRGQNYLVRIAAANASFYLEDAMQAAFGASIEKGDLRQVELRSPKELANFADKLRKEHRSQVIGNFIADSQTECGLLASFGFHDVLQVVEQPGDLTSLHLSVLRAYGRNSNVPGVKLACAEEAYELANQRWGKGHAETCHCLSALCKLLKDHTEFFESRLRDHKMLDRDLYEPMNELEQWLGKRVRYLNAMEWHKDARAVEKKLQITQMDFYALLDRRMRDWLVRLQSEEALCMDIESCQGNAIVLARLLAALAERMELPHVAARWGATLQDLAALRPAAAEDVARTAIKSLGATW
jgi:hypothetical protein